jgi:tetratricopeptide (TPR) repeat protein
MVCKRVALVLSLLVLAGCAGSGRRMWRAETAHVRVTSELSLEDAEATAQKLEGLRAALTHVFFACASGKRASLSDVTVIARQDEVERLTREDHGAGHAVADLDGVVVLPTRLVVSHEAFEEVSGTQVFVHELMHDLVRVCFPDAPPWVQEGFAKAYETIHVGEDGRTLVVGMPSMVASASEPFLALVRRRGVEVLLVPRHLVPPVEKLTNLGYGEFYEAKETALGPEEVEQVLGRYAGAWGLVHMMHFGPDTDLRGRFARYLGALGAGTEMPSHVFREAFSDVDLEARLARYLAASSYAQERVAFPQLDVARPPGRELGRAEVSLHLAELELQFGHEERQVRGRLEAFESTARPEEPGLRAMKVRAELLRAQLEDGPGFARHVHAALQEDPRSLDALRALGVVALEREATGDAAAHSVRGLLTRKDLRPTELSIVARVMVAAGRPGTGLRYAKRAVELDPAHFRSRLALGEALLDLGEIAAARRSLRSAANLIGHGQPDRAREIYELVERLEKAERKTAP